MTIEETIKKYLDEGYLPLSSLYEEYKKIETIYVDDKTIRELLFSDFDSTKFADDDTCVFVKPAVYYHLKPQDMIKLIDISEDQDDFIRRLQNIRFNNLLFLPELEKDKVKVEDDDNDFFLEDEDVLIRFIFKTVLDWNDKHIQEKELIKSFIIDIIKEKDKKLEDREYNDDALSIMLYRYCSTLKGNPLYESFYKQKLIKLASKNNLLALYMIGYDYYSGEHGFKQDYYLAEKYLLQNFEITNDPNLARTLRYVYYYGRINNGEIEGDKAFKYFAYAHFAGKYYEATYKLADCYLHGYGTFQSNEAAFNLVSSIFNETRVTYLEDEFSKYADVALRMGSYLLNGIGTTKNLNLALRCFLEARDAIKIRLEKFNENIDIPVAFSIQKNIDETKKELNLKDRVIVKDGYLMENYSDYWSNIDIKITKEDDEFYRITIIPNENQFVIGGDESIYLKEKVNKVEYLVSLESSIDVSILDKTIDSVEFDYNELNISFDDDFQSYLIKKLVYVPQNIKNLDKHVTLATIKFYEGGKEYEYYSEDNVDVGDIVKVNSYNGPKEVKVLKVRKIYEDELAVPLKFMGRVRKI